MTELRITKKRFCKDCKHSRGIGFDFWCGEGHTEYEVFGAETNCPYYEFHDWSKGVPRETEDKRFEVFKTNIMIGINDNGESIGNVYDTCNLLNKLNNELQEFQKKNKELKALVSFYKSFQEDARKLEKENRQLKQKEGDLGTACAEEIDKIEEEFDKEISRLIRENNQIKTKINFYKKESGQLKEQLKDCQQKKQNIKDLLMNSEPVVEQKKLQKIIYRAVNILIDEKIDELEEKYRFGQEVYRGCPMHNIRFGINVLKELKRELPDDRD